MIASEVFPPLLLLRSLLVHIDLLWREVRDKGG